MRYSRSELLRLKDLKLNLDEDLYFSKEAFLNVKRIKDLKDVHVYVEGEYEPETQHLKTRIHVKGIMICPCDITGEDVNIKFDSEAEETFTFRKEDDYEMIPSKGEYIELLPTIFAQILLEIPTTIVKDGEINYPAGDGWAVMSEEMARKQRDERPDPRWAKLSEYIPQDDKEV